MRGCFALALVTASVAQALGGPIVSCGGLADLLRGARIEATSQASDKYRPSRALDGNPSTWWASRTHPELPQQLRITLTKPQTIDTILIVPANFPKLYSWIKTLTVRVGGEARTVRLPDRFQPVVVRFGKPLRADNVLVSIDEVHSPNYYVGIAEVKAFLDPEGKVKVIPDWRQPWLDADRTPQGRAEHPCVYVTPEDIRRAREAARKESWAREYLERLRRQAEPWLDRSDQWIREHIPDKGACFAYGITGCPICGAGWGTWAGARCSFDNPGHVTCYNGHVLPDAEHPDPGTGYRAPDGRIHYFVGSYNAWVVETMAFKGVRPLVALYTLTGEEKYADKASVILDALADIYPTCTKGSWDYPSHPPSGRLNRPWYQVARVLVHYVDWYDRLYNSPALDKPSIRPGLTRRENIEKNLLLDGAEYCYRCSLDRGCMGLALHNGCADYIRGALAVGCCLGVPVYVRWALDGPFGIRSLLANNVDGDGRYYETSVSYADHTRDLYLTFAAPLLNWRDSGHPHGVDIYRLPQFARFYEAPAAAIACAGHKPRFGDASPDFRYAPPEVPPVFRSDIRLLLAASRSPSTRYLLSLATALLGGPRLAARFLERYGDAHELLMRGGVERLLRELPGLDRRLRDIGRATTFFGRKGIAVLRANGPGDRQALLLRWGPSLNHGHFDDLGFNYYALGYELTYDLGYGLGSTHTQVGWAKQTAAHSLVVVDEQRQGNGPGSGGSLHYLMSAPWLQLVDADSPMSYSAQGVGVYERTLALIGVPPECYAVDVFRVLGGKQHDYFFHALGDQIQAEGLQWGPVEAGSLAGPDVRWGDKIGNDGDIKGRPNKPYWVAPPGNGYGFLVDVQRAQPKAPFSVTWPIAGSPARLTMTPAWLPDAEVITAWGPGLRPRYPRARYLVLRRKSTSAPLASTFASAYQPWQERVTAALVTAADVWRGAGDAPGELIYISGPGLVLWKAPDSRAVLSLSLPAVSAGEYLLRIRHYQSPAYGRVEVKLDGRSIGQIDGRGEKVMPAAPAVLGPIKLPAGPHRLALRVARPSSDGNYWFGLQQIELCRATAGRATVESVRLLTETPAAPQGPWPVAVMIEHRDGVRDYVATAPLGTTGRTGGEEGMEWSGVVYWRERQGRVTRVALMGGHVSTPAFSVSLEPGAWQGRVQGVDYGSRLVRVSASLPADGRLDGALIVFSNPAYSRTTAYRVAAARRDGSATVLELEADPTLGLLQVDEIDEAANVFWSLIPHEYMRGLGRPTRFFAGKRIDAGGEKLAAIVQADYGSPCVIHVDDASKLPRGEKVFIRDVQTGDRFVVLGWAAVDMSGARPVSVAGNTGAVVTGRWGKVRLQWRR